MFEKAARLKVRFTYKGTLTSEDLWDLTPVELDSIYRGLNHRRKELQEESLINKKTAEEDLLDLQVSLIKRVVEVKELESAAKKVSAEKRAKKAKIMEIIANKEDSDLQGKSKEDLLKLLSELD